MRTTSSGQQGEVAIQGHGGETCMNGETARLRLMYSDWLTLGYRNADPGVCAPEIL